MNCDSSSVFIVTTSATNNLIMILEETLHSIQRYRADEKQKPREEYMGYDKRDMADYHSEGYERNFDSDPLSEEENHHLAEKEALAIDEKTLLLILQQMYGQRSDALSDVINTNIAYTSCTVVSKLSNSVETLLHLAKGLEEESFMQIINIVSLINGHFIPSIADNQTEVRLYCNSCCDVFDAEVNALILLVFEDCSSFRFGRIFGRLRSKHIPGR